MRLINKPEGSKMMAKEDIFQFYEDWTSGKLLPNIADYLDEQSSKYGNINVWVDSSNMYYGLPLYLKNVSKVSIKWIPEDKNLYNQLNQIDKGKTYIISNRLEINGIPYSQTIDFQLSSRHKIKIGQI